MSEDSQTEVLFLDVLKDRIDSPCLEDYCHFLIKEHAPENLLFWQRAENIRVLETMKDTEEEIVEAFDELYDLHIARRGRFEVNLPADVKSKLITDLKEKKLYKYSTVKVAQKHTYSLMVQDSFKRFLREYNNQSNQSLNVDNRKRGNSVSSKKSSDSEDKVGFFKKFSLKKKKSGKSENSTEESPSVSVDSTRSSFSSTPENLIITCQN
eukprot:Awhi_evm1s12407